MIEALRAAVGAAHVEEGAPVRVRPGAAPEVAELLRACRLSGRTLGVGRGDVALDLGRMTQVLDLDETSLLVHVQAGLAVSALEAQLAARGMTLGAAGRRAGARSVGAVLAAPHPVEAAPGGRLTDACAAIDGVLGDGALVHTKLAPRRATGPDLAQALIGGRGATGIVVGAWLRCVRRPVERAPLAFRFADGAAALAAARTLLKDGIRPADLALFDDRAARGATLAVLLAGEPETTAAERAHAVACCAGAQPDDAAAALLAGLPGGPGRALAWRDLAAAWAGREPGAALWAVAPSGAALVSRSPAPAAVRNPLDEELARALDPQALLAR